MKVFIAVGVASIGCCGMHNFILIVTKLLRVLPTVRVESCVLSPAFQIKPGQPRASPVWEHFVYDASKDKSICQVCVVEGDADSAATLEGRLCGVEVSGKYPTNLKAHLKAVHALTYDAVVQKEAANKIERERTGVLNLCQLCSSCWCLSPL